jgi:hypothetical protein
MKIKIKKIIDNPSELNVSYFRVFCAKEGKDIPSEFCKWCEYSNRPKFAEVLHIINQFMVFCSFL